MLLLLVCTFQSAGAQADNGWHASLEAGVTSGGTWLEGANAPTVMSGTGFFAGVGAHRPVSSRSTAGVTLRAISSRIQVSEDASTWNAGRLLELQLMATGSLTKSWPQIRASADLLGGLSFLQGAQDIAPFSTSSSAAPVAALGISLSRPGESRRISAAFFVNYHLTYLRAKGNDARVESGAVSRILAGLRFTR